MKGVYYNRQYKAWMRSGSSQKYSSKKKAELGAKISRGRAIARYEREGFIFDYRHTVGSELNLVTDEDRPDTPGADGEWGSSETGTAVGRGFFDLFNSERYQDVSQFEQVYSIKELIKIAESDDNVRAFLNRIYIETRDDFKREVLGFILYK